MHAPAFLTVVILVPTRELALQTSAVLRGLAKHLPNVSSIVTTGEHDNRFSCRQWLAR